MDSGRGVQACVRMKALPDRGTVEWDEARSLAARIQAFLVRLHDPRLVVVDDVWKAASRFTRMAGTVNSKTGRVARIVRGAP